MIRKLLGLGCLICIIGFIWSLTKGNGGAAVSFGVVFFVLGTLGAIAEKIAGWLGLDERPTRSTRAAGEFFLDASGDILDNGLARRIRDVGDTIEIRGRSYSIRKAYRDEKGDYIYHVA